VTLESKKTIINIDESVIQTTDHRRKGWVVQGKKSLRTVA
jgi:hypothetical protein